MSKKLALKLACIFSPLLGYAQIAGSKSVNVKYIINKEMYDTLVTSEFDYILRSTAIFEEDNEDLVLMLNINEANANSFQFKEESSVDIIYELEKIGALKYENNGNDTHCGGR